jgi:tetratricopeptide (TPR) repeat protein
MTFNSWSCGGVLLRDSQLSRANGSAHAKLFSIDMGPAAAHLREGPGGGTKMTVSYRRLAGLAAVAGLVGWAATAHADWAACQRKPTRACLLEEALRGDRGPLAGKERLEVLIIAGADGHPEYATAADIDEAVRQVKSNPNGYDYSYVGLAIQGLVAEHRTQDAVDLTASLPLRGGAYAAFNELTRTLAKLGDLDTTAALIKRMPPLEPTSTAYFIHQRAVVSVETLAEAGKIEDALPLMTSALADHSFRFSDIARMQIAVAQAYAGRGDARTAQRFFDQAGQVLEQAQASGLNYVSGEARISLIALSALRGDVEAVRTGLQKVKSEGPPNNLVDYRTQVYPRVVASLVKAKQLAFALEVAKSAPESIFKDLALANVSGGNAANGRIEEARAVMTLFSDKLDSRNRAAAVRNIAVAMVKAGKLAEAVEMAAQLSDLTGRKATLFAIAQQLPQ